MPKVSVDLINAAPSRVEMMAAYLAARELGSVESGTLYVDVETYDDCYVVGAALTGFLQSDNGSYELSLDGPGAASVIHQLRTEHDLERISLTIATCAGFQ